MEKNKTDEAEGKAEGNVSKAFGATEMHNRCRG